MSGRRRIAVGCAFGVLSAACGSDTTDAPATCKPSAFEPNETYGAASYLGEVEDDPAPTSQASKERRADASLDAAADVDWFRVTVYDTGIGGDPLVRVIVGEGTVATVWYQCTSPGAPITNCQLGTKVSDPARDGEACATAPGDGAAPQLTMTTDCAATESDDGDLLVRVARAGSAADCVPYTIVVSVE